VALVRDWRAVLPAASSDAANLGYANRTSRTAAHRTSTAEGATVSGRTTIGVRTHPARVARGIFARVGSAGAATLAAAAGICRRVSAEHAATTTATADCHGERPDRDAPAHSIHEGYVAASSSDGSRALSVVFVTHTCRSRR